MAGPRKKKAAKKPAPKKAKPNTDRRSAAFGRVRVPKSKTLPGGKEKITIVPPAAVASRPVTGVPYSQPVFFPPANLPSGYNDNSIYALVRDPYWTYTYWEIRKDLEESKLRELGGDRNRVKSVLRIYDLSASREHSIFSDIVLQNMAMSWYIHTEPNKTYVIEIGLLHEDGRFIALARSNEITTPRAGMSDVIDEEWMGIDFDRMYALSGGFQVGKSSMELRELMEKRLRESVSSGSGASSLSGPVEIEKKGFWFVLDCEVVVYGATDPGAAVTVQGKPVKLRPDGTFTLRFALPDGKLVLDAAAVSPDQGEIRKIVPVIERNTERPAPFLKFKTKI